MNEKTDSTSAIDSTDSSCSFQQSLSENNKNRISDYFSTLSDLEELLFGISTLLKNNPNIQRQNNDPDITQAPIHTEVYELPENFEENLKNGPYILFLNSDPRILSLDFFKQKTRYILSLPSVEVRQRLQWCFNTAKEIVSNSHFVTRYCTVEISFVYPHLRNKIIFHIIKPDDVDEKNMVELSDWLLYEYCKDLSDFLQREVFTQIENGLTLSESGDNTDLNSNKESKTENISVEETLDRLLKPLTQYENSSGPCIKNEFRRYLYNELLHIINDEDYTPSVLEKPFKIKRGQTNTFYNTMKTIKETFKIKRGSLFKLLTNCLGIKKGTFYNYFSN